MKLLSLIFITLLSGIKAFATDNSVCTYYFIKSSELNCSSENYLLRFGYRYCQLFLRNEKLFTARGQIVLNSIRNCLIDQLQHNKDLTCSNIKAASQTMHFQCYMESDFCNLSFWDKNVILWFIRNEIADPTFFKTLLQISRQCHITSGPRGT